MRELSEQEQLARLVGNSGSDDLMDAGSLLEQSLRSAIGNVSVEKMNQVRDEISAHGDVEEGVRQPQRVASKINNGSGKDFSTEKLLIDLYDLKDELVSAFETAGVNTKASRRIEACIKKAEKSILTVGGDVERFIPLNHLSGLSVPNFFKNAEKVIETTMQCYQLGKIETAKIKEDGKSIQIVFSGVEGDTEYRVDGIVTADEWMGNEAIDYIYTPGEGNMTVKAFENGKWVVKSLRNSNKYKVLWNLEEKPIEMLNKISVNKIEKEEEAINTLNNMGNEEEIGEPIR
jgi:hypothetical protein